MKRLLGLLLACTSLPASAQDQVIRIWGPASMAQAAQVWADDYHVQHPDVRFELTMKGSDTAIPGLYSGKADIALMGRENDITDDNGFGRVKGYAPKRFELLRGSLATPEHSPALVVLVRADNPLTGISLAQLREIVGAPKPGKNQTAIPGGISHVHVPDIRSGTGIFLRRILTGNANNLNWPAVTEHAMHGTTGFGEIAAAVRADPKAIGIGSLADTDGLKVIPVLPDKGTQAIPANADTLRLGLYPFARHAYAFVDMKPGTKLAPHLAAFLRYAMSEQGQSLIAKSGGWLPVDEATITRNMFALDMQIGDPTKLARATASSQPAYQPQTRVSGTIAIWGHGSFKRDFVGRLIQRWFTEFQRFQPDARLDYRMYGTASAISALATGAGNLALLGEEISPEQAETFRRAKGYDATMIDVANGSLKTNFFDYAHMVFVGKDNPLQSISLPELERLFGAERKCGAKGAPIRQWGDLGQSGAWASKPIVPYMWKTDTDFAQLLRQRVLCDSHRWNPATREILVRNKPDGTPYELGQQLLDALGEDRLGIAMSSIRYTHPNVKALPISKVVGGPAVEPSERTLIERSYPLGRIIPAFIDQAPGKPVEPVVREFLRYILSREGQTALVEESGYLPLSLETANLQREKLK